MVPKIIFLLALDFFLSFSFIVSITSNALLFWIEKGSFSEIKIHAPVILGFEFSGIVEKVGSRVPNTFAVGDEVVGISPLDIGGINQYFSL